MGSDVTIDPDIKAELDAIDPSMVPVFAVVPDGYYRYEVVMNKAEIAKVCGFHGENELPIHIESEIRLLVDPIARTKPVIVWVDPATHPDYM